VGSLAEKTKNLDQELVLLKQELSSTTSLVQRGLAIAPREFELRQTALETQGRRLDLDTAALRAKEDIGKADQSIIELRGKTRNQIQADLADIEQKLPETAARIATSTSIVDHETGATPNDAAAEVSTTTCLILRPGEGQTTQIAADEMTKIEPGDTIRVLRAGEAAPQSGLRPALAVDPPEQAVNARPRK
jgi:hypothetical protein